MKRLLITGAGGFLGWNLCRELKDRFEIFGVVRSRRVALEGIRSLEVDLTDHRRTQALFRQVRPDAVIYAAAAAKPDICQLHPIESARINVDAPIFMASLCAESKIPMVFTSSDLVFDGQNPPYREEYPVSPISTYGKQKVMAEEGILKCHSRAVVCRMALMFGDGGPHTFSFLKAMVTSMRLGEELKLFTDEFRTPLSGRDAARGLALALDHAEGLLHLGGRERISRYDLGLLTARVFGISEPAVTPALQREVPTPAPRSSDVSLDCSKAHGLGFSPAPLEEALRELRSLW